jgi:penicillin-binding protein 1B
VGWSFRWGAATLFIVLTLHQIPLDEIKSVLAQSLETDQELENKGSFNYLEADSFVRATDLQTYIAFSKHPRWPDLVSLWSRQEDEVVAIEKEFILPPPTANDCLELYCLQLRRPFADIPSVLWRGLIGIEDIRFLGHVGFDVRAIARALFKDIISLGFVEGGSTITQQLAKNLFLSSEKSLWRKLKELVVAVAIEARFEKDEIIQAYLNEVYWGVLQGVRVKGFHAASMLYFHKLPNHLSSYEALILVSLLKGPSYYHPLRHLERLRARVDVIARNLQDKEIVAQDMVLWSEQNWLDWQEKLRRFEQAHARPLFSWWLSSKSDSGALGDYGKFVFVRGGPKRFSSI